LVAVLVGDDPASKVYVRNKHRAAEACGVNSSSIELPASVSADELLQQIASLNRNDDVDGFIVQLPLPKHLDERPVLLAVAPEKDVDCFHPYNVGLLVEGHPDFSPCTPAAVLELLRRSGAKLAGADVVVVGRSNIVGKPLAIMLAQKSIGATVTLCHTQTRDLAVHTRRAEVVVAAAGKPGLITGGMLAPGAVVIDVGTNRLPDGRLLGDCDFDSVRAVARAVTPVPGGVGPMTCTMLIRNAVVAAERRI
jgi:methylenetetrahydrofolate dehydrogenase (NADP+)/methenyltetrahydrofolate cyclohydrolase